MREGVTYVTSSLVGWDLALPDRKWAMNEFAYNSIDACIYYHLVTFSIFVVILHHKDVTGVETNSIHRIL